nr:putative ribonuclease H-like domain-containing protein [Tanacetum cinerariifolium]
MTGNKSFLSDYQEYDGGFVAFTCSFKGGKITGKGASLDRKSTTGSCQFLGSRLISWQCKKQTIVANSTTEAKYIATSSCWGQVLWLQNQLLDYGYNFMQTKIHVDNKSAICAVKNLVYHSKTKHIEIRHHFIRDSYEKRLIETVKIHTESNVADLLTKAFDVTRLYMLDTWTGVQKWSRIKLKENLLNDGYADLVQHDDKKELAIPGQTATEPFSSLNNSMANLKFVDQHNMVAYLEKSDDNTEFHQIVDFLSSCSITYALTLMGKAVVISESLVRSDLLFDDENGITCLTNDEIFENLALIGYEPLSTKLTFQKGGYTPGSDEGRITLAKLMETCIILPNRVTQLETELSTTKAVYNKAFITLTNRFKKLESQLKKKRSRAVIHSSKEEGPREVQETAEHSRDDDDETLAETLLNIKRSSAKDKGKGIMQETYLPKKLKKKEMIQLSLDEELAQKLYAEELAKEENRPFSKAEVRKNMIMYLKNQGGHKQSYFKGMNKEAQRSKGADESTRRYTSMINLLENIDREDLETLWKLVKEKYGKTRPEEGYERVL